MSSRTPMKTMAIRMIWYQSVTIINKTTTTKMPLTQKLMMVNNISSSKLKQMVKTLLHRQMSNKSNSNSKSLQLAKNLQMYTSRHSTTKASIANCKRIIRVSNTLTGYQNRCVPDGFLTLCLFVRS